MVEDIEVRFGPTRALTGVSLTAPAGACLGLVGPNGAGKTTLLDAIAGLVRPGKGAVRLEGRNLTGLPIDEVARAGVARTFQTPRVFTRMTLEENVRAGRRLEAGSWLGEVGLEGRRDELAGSLTPGDQRRLELARALAGNPRLLLLDEPCGGLTPTETDAMAELLTRAMAGRITLLVEHKLPVVVRVCDRAVVLHAGLAIFDGPPLALASDPVVARVYLGKPVAPGTAGPVRPPGAPEP